MVEIIQANTDDHKILTDITKKSKAYWGYSEQQMNEWSDLLTVSSEYIQNNKVFKLIVNESIVGYFSYMNIENNLVRLDNLFVLPEYIGKGYGKLLLNHFILNIRQSGITRIILDADPNAEKFYESFGFIKTGQIKTSIKDRFLPIMELVL
ncbi:hypothetical protein CHRY9390_03183 [Chryseobacterium aquaeductus]|uniref:N-acetyltransferase domain-containing protein n=1 Tax=Chryseobacterium aquaeductus TaxID=2675056 RepID=A0A9N8MJC1_9FLAO|nr:GNAT family N-acetyltransferase [Chryseobacterium aquaeductus]CAA7332460.1 hypothetical protein CHRY9390_03183 [Chryseobacterium potabilaquae]CAD7816507.1 hypothetical protein CHRY9390_03183 [Chryseobacterium aquaeductus]